MSKGERSELAELAGKTSVPQVFVNGVCIGGCNDGSESWMGVMPLLGNGKLQKAAEKDMDREECLKILKD